MPRIRQDVAKLGSEWHWILEWYAKAIAKLDERTPDDRTSWRYLGGMHGFESATWIAEGIITAANPLPPTAEWDGRMWNQCQHGGWYFLPWHRGYLAAFEAMIVDAIREMEGPHEEWALPYWNYLDDTNPTARQMPAEFLQPALPDGSANPLSSPPRGGTTTLGPTPWLPQDIDLDAMTVRRFTSAPGALGFGGGVTVFNQFSQQTGAVESDPHNLVHVMIGGVGATPGFMSDPILAGLDPIFWLHHCNVDRLWEAWLSRSQNTMESSAAWRNGPAPRRFEIPTPDRTLSTFTPEETLPGGRLAPTYDDLAAGTGLGALPAAVGEEPGAEPVPAKLSSEPPPPATLVGASAAPLSVTGAPVRAAVTIDSAAIDPASDPQPQRLYLNLEGIRGVTPSGVLTVRLHAPAAGALPAGAEPPLVKTVALFGLAKAAAPDGEHGGAGINISIDITDIVRELAQTAGAPLDEVQVQLEQPGGAELPPITVGRVSLYKQPAE